MKFWHVEDGAVMAEIPQGQTQPLNENLLWKGEVQDFELTFDYRIDRREWRERGHSVSRAKTGRGKPCQLSGVSR